MTSAARRRRDERRHLKWLAHKLAERGQVLGSTDLQSPPAPADRYYADRGWVRPPVVDWREERQLPRGRR